MVIGTIGFVMQGVRTALDANDPTGNAVGNLLNISLIVGPLIILALFERTQYHVNMNIFYRTFAPIISVSLLPIPFLGLQYSYTAMSCLYATFSIASIMGILACAQVSRHYRIPSITIYAFLFGLIYTARYLPSLIAGILCSSRVLSLRDIALTDVSTVGIFALFAAYVASDRFLSRQREANVHTWESALPPEDDLVLPITQEQITDLASREGLTNREAEMLAKLREGRSVPYIAKSLCITENTVKYHCKNIYRKLGVHSRQELFDRLDNEAKPNEEPSS